MLHAAILAMATATPGPRVRSPRQRTQACFALSTCHEHPIVCFARLRPSPRSFDPCNYAWVELVPRHELRAIAKARQRPR
jgi:hypothetical protein